VPRVARAARRPRQPAQALGADDGAQRPRLRRGLRWHLGELAREPLRPLSRRADLARHGSGEARAGGPGAGGARGPRAGRARAGPPGGRAVWPDGSRLARVRRSRDRPAELVVWSTAPDLEAERRWREAQSRQQARDPQDVPAVRTRPLPRKPLHTWTASGGG